MTRTSEKAAVREVLRAFRGRTSGLGTIHRVEAPATPGWPDMFLAARGVLVPVEAKVGVVGVDGATRFRVRPTQTALWWRLARDGVRVVVLVRQESGRPPRAPVRAPQAPRAARRTWAAWDGMAVVANTRSREAKLHLSTSLGVLNHPPGKSSGDALVSWILEMCLRATVWKS